MGCKLSVSVVHPYKSPLSSKKRPIESPIFNSEKHVASDDDSYVTINLDTPPDSTRKKV